MRKTLTVILSLSLIIATVNPGAWAQEGAVGPPGLAQLEQILYGQVQEGAILPRLERIETDVYGRPQQGSTIIVRLQELVNLLTGAQGDVPLTMKLNAVEWVTFQKVSEGPSIAKRLEQMEIAIFGQTNASMGLVERLNTLLSLMWPGGKVYVADTRIPAGTLVRIELLTGLDSETNKPGQEVRYRVVDDVRIDQQIVIPAGSIGVGRIESVTASGRLGQDGRVQVNWGTVRAMDAKPVSLAVAERATEQNRSLDLAAGASIAGVVLLGPVGLAAGYFVRGRPHVVPLGTTFFVEVAADTTVKALSLGPSVASGSSGH